MLLTVAVSLPLPFVLDLLLFPFPLGLRISDDIVRLLLIPDTLCITSDFLSSTYDVYGLLTVD